MKNLASILIICSLTILSGCSSFKVQEYNQQANTHIKTIGLLKPKQPENLSVFYFNHPGMQFGLIGGLAAAAEFSSKTDSYNKLLKEQHFDPAQYYVERLQYHLMAAGFDVALVDASMSKNEFRTSFPAADVDAFIDAYFGAIGYYAGSPSSAYKPTIRIPTHLVDSKSKKVVFANIFNTGEAFGLNKEWAYLSIDKFQYKDFDTLKANAPTSLDGLKQSLDAIAQAVAASLKSDTHA